MCVRTVLRTTAAAIAAVLAMDGDAWPADDPPVTAVEAPTEAPAGEVEPAAEAPAEAPPAELIPDDHLERVIRAILKRKQIDKPQIEEADLKTIFFLDARKQQIASLAGLEKCTNLVSVNLPDNAIEDLSPLAGLKNIQTLTVSGNRIASLLPVAELVKLQLLDASNNVIESLDHLAKLENLRTLWLANNQVSSLAPLAGLKKLTSLDLDGNQVVDLAPLAELKWLSTLRLRQNQIGDLAPLQGLAELRFTFLEGNPVSDLAPLVEMARHDVEGEQRFAPYWRLYLDEDALADDQRAHVEALRSLGVRVNVKAD